MRAHMKKMKLMYVFVCKVACDYANFTVEPRLCVCLSVASHISETSEAIAITVSVSHLTW